MTRAAVAERPLTPEEVSGEPFIDDLEEEMAARFPEPPPPPAAHRLHRGRRGRMIAGVCAGLADHLGVDPVVLRVVFLFLAIGGGFGGLLYLLCWILIPEEVEGAGSPGSPPAMQSR